jgi:hypothetical protein
MENQVNKIINFERTPDRIIGVVEKPGVELECDPVDKAYDAVCKFDWTANFSDENNILFKVNFTNPIEVS